MYRENINGEYDEYNSDTFPIDEYTLNISESYCVDRNENRISGTFSF